MVIKFGRHRIFIKDMPSMRMVQAMTQLNYEVVLYEAILDWTLPRKISLSNVSNLNWEVAKLIIDYYTAKVNELMQDQEAINSLIRTIIVHGARPLPEHPIVLKYGERLRVCFPCVDNEANLVILPSGSNTETMRVDDFIIIEAIIAAKAEYIKREQARLRR